MWRHLSVISGAALLLVITVASTAVAHPRSLPSSSTHLPSTVDSVIVRLSLPYGQDTLRSLPRLTAPVLAKFLAVDTAARRYAEAPDHPERLQMAQAALVRLSQGVGKDTMRALIFDYNILADSDSTVAALFTAHQFDRRVFAPVQAAILEAWSALLTMQYWHAPAPAATSRLGQNIALVQQHAAALAPYRFAVTLPVKLTDTVVTQFLALRRELQTYWAAPAHTKLLQQANATEMHYAVYAIGSIWGRIGNVYDYPALVGQDRGLAALFTKHHLTPAQYPALQVAIHSALMEVLGYDKNPTGTQIPTPTSMAGKNMAVVRRQYLALEAAGLLPYQQEPIALDASGKQGYMKDSEGTSWYVRPIDP